MRKKDYMSYLIIILKDDEVLDSISIKCESCVKEFIDVCETHVRNLNSGIIYSISQEEIQVSIYRWNRIIKDFVQIKNFFLKQYFGIDGIKDSVFNKLEFLLSSITHWNKYKEGVQ